MNFENNLKSLTLNCICCRIYTGDGMYSYFKGIIKDIANDKVILEVSNIGYDIYMAENDLLNVNLEDNIMVYTYFQHREDEMKLFGFLERNKLQFFKKLISVSGVGSKVALGIISNISVEDMCTAIITENVLALKAIPGIGPKMASKIIFELKDKIANEDVITVSKSKNTVAINEAINAMKVLGYSEKELSNCIGDMDLEDKSTQEIIKMCLKHMQKR